MEEAQVIIVTLDAQLLMDDSIYHILLQQHSDDIVTATSAISIADVPQTTNTPLCRGNDDNPGRSTVAATQDSSVSTLQPIQLRRLELPTFDGDVANFYDFWCRFKTAVHENDSLSLSTKFIYLANSLKGSAALLIQGYDPSKPENYHFAIQALKKRYDRPHFTHGLFHQRLERLPTSSTSAGAQRDTLCQIQSFVMQLNRYEDTTTSWSLMTLIKKKFPRETQLEVNKLEHRSGKTWTLPELLDALNEVIEEFEKLEDYAVTTSGSLLAANPVSVERSRTPTPEPRYDPTMFCFCNSYNHPSRRCHYYMPPSNRRIIVNSLRLCWKCLRAGHPSRACSRSDCSRCGGPHHHLICTHSTRRYRSPDSGRRPHSRESSCSSSERHSRSNSPRRATSFERGASRSPSRKRSLSARRHYERTPSPHHGMSDRPSSSQRRTVRFQSPVRDNSPYRGSSYRRDRTQDRELPVYSALDSDEEYEKVMDLHRDKSPSATQVSTTLDTTASSTLMTVEAKAINPQTATEDVDPISRFDKLDIIGINDNPDPSLDQEEDARILQQFQNTVQEIDGLLYVQFPWKISHPRLADNKLLALKRLESQYKSFTNKPDLWKLYASTIQDYLDKGIIEEVDEYHFDDHRIYYIPHQAVVKESSATTRLRVVFDASSHYKGAPSLNDCLYPGPSILPDLVGILLRSRLHPILLISDVEKAFLQIRLQRSQRDATRFLWLIDPFSPPTSSNLRIFRFTRVPFGITASPFLLAASILYYLRRDPNSLLNKEIENNTYVDNILLGATTVEEAIRKYHDSKSLFSSMHMNLRQFHSNSSAVNTAIDVADRLICSSHVPLLGLHWKPIRDTLFVPIKTTNRPAKTKRAALRALASTFDPLGLLSPFLAPLKVFLQDLWTKSYQWDDQLDDEDLARWNQLVQDLEHPIPPTPRCILPLVSPSELQCELCVFTDASKRLYASCIYLLCRNSSTVAVNLLMAKSLLGPRQPITMPRMELLASLIGLRLVRFVHTQLHRKIAAVHIFSDSQIVLYWIHSSRPLRTFVRNRVTEIRNIVESFRSSSIPVHFYYVNSQENPADCASRGIPTSIAKDHIWWSGPPFLRLPSSQWPGANNFTTPPANDDEVHNEYQTLSVAQCHHYKSPFRFQCNSRYSKLVRSTVYVLKFFAILAAKTNYSVSVFDSQHFIPSTDISPTEFSVAETLLIKEHYRESEPLLLRMPLQRFNAHRSSDGLIRCPHRMQHAANPIKATILLVPSHPLVKLVIMHVHLLQFHSGVHATIATLRRSYFIPSIRNAVTKVLRSCIICKRMNGLPYRYPAMPSLPKERVNRSRPFQNIGLDYFGPLRYKDTSVTTSKIWISLFTCMTTRAIHLEIVMDNSTHEFLLAFRRFVARRGTPEYILSDNATTFCAAKSVLQQLLSSRTATCRIQWKFITPLSPWKGGFYERLVGLVKSSLKKSIGRYSLPLQHLHTILLEIEAVLNSRPLTSIADTISSPTILRPIDFLAPQVNLHLPTPEIPYFYYSQPDLAEWYRSMSDVLDHFWNAWATDYLSAVAQRHTSTINQGKSTPKLPSVGEVVLVNDKQQPRPQWNLAVITEVSRDQHNIIRAATVRLPNGNHLKRSNLLRNRTRMSDKQKTMKRSASPAESDEKSSTPLPAKHVKSPVGIQSGQSSATDSLVAVLTALQNTNSSPSSQNSFYRARVHPRLTNSGASAQLHRPYRERTPLELISALAKGNYDPDYVSYADDDASQDGSLPPDERLSLRIAQSLTIAANFEHTFSVEQLATRDYVMIDAFLRHAIYFSFRDCIVDDATLPTPADLDYPPVKKYSIYLIVQAYKGLHAANQKSKSFVKELSEHVEYWKSEEKLAELYEQLLAILYNIQNHRNTLTDLLIPNVLNPIEDNKELVDMLSHFNVTLCYIKVVCTTATGETATGFLTLKKINSAIARLHNITLESSLPAESIDLSDIPTIEEMHAVTGGPVPVSPSPLESPETSTAQAVRRTTQKSTSDLHIRSSTFVTTTRRTNTPPHHKKITVSLTPRTSPTPSSSSRNRGTRTVRAVRTVSPSRSPDRHRRQRMSPSRLRRPSPPREPQPPHLVCHFCQGNHYSAGCTEVKSLTDRAIRAVSVGKCLYCLKAHSPGYCKRNIACRVCDSTEHHPALCPLSYFLIRDIGPDVSKFFGAMYVLYENYHRCR
ncbi:hypothetical protein V3C99_014862 [Haemonchus contortus]